MAHTRSRRRGPHRTLRREAPSIVAVVADQAHFARMRAYHSFAFDDHQSYLRQTEGLLRALTAQGVHARVALFDPVDYELYCQEEQLDPDTAHSRTRYTAEVATAGATLPYDGQAITQLLPRLLDAHAVRLTWDAATDVLSRTGPCARCGTDIGGAAFERAAQALAQLLEALGPGAHHLVGSVGVPGTPLVTALDVRKDADGGELHAHEAAALALTTALAAGLATGSPGGVVLRTDAGARGTDGRKGRGGRDTVRGWSLDTHADWLRPLTTAEVFTAYCTDPATGEPVPPEAGVDYAPGIDLPGPGGALHC